MARELHATVFLPSLTLCCAEPRPTAVSRRPRHTPPRALPSIVLHTISISNPNPNPKPTLTRTLTRTLTENVVIIRSIVEGINWNANPWNSNTGGMLRPPMGPFIFAKTRIALGQFIRSRKLSKASPSRNSNSKKPILRFPKPRPGT